MKDIEWFPNPQTFREALAIADDSRIVDLRSRIDLWVHRLSIGEYRDLSDIRKEIRAIVAGFSNKSWATRVSRLVTYLAIPTTVLDLLMSGGAIGATLSVVGTGAQWLGDRIETNKRRSWVSLGHDAYFTKPK